MDGESNSQNSLVPVEVETRILDIQSFCNTSPVAFLKKEHTKIMALEKDDNFFLTLGIMFTKIANLGGIKGEISDINKQDISKMILRRNKSLSLEEIYFAFELERYGEYEDKTNHFQLFNADYVSTILKKYNNWKSKTKIQFNLHTALKPKEKELTNEEKETIVEQGIERFFEEFKETGEIPIGCVYIYDFLRKKGRIKPPTDAYRKRIKKKAESNVDEYNKNKKAHSVFSSVFHQGNTQKQVENECKRLALIDYFKQQLKALEDKND